MDLIHIKEVWTILKTHVDSFELSTAADELVSYLIDEDFSPAEIKQEFRGDKEIKKALEYFLEVSGDTLSSDDDEDDDDYNSHEDY